jgi:hypothetical protein
MASKLIYVLAALVVLLAYLEITNKVIEDKRHLEAMGAFKGYVGQARAAGITGNEPPDPSVVALPDGYTILIVDDYVVLKESGEEVARERWR